MTANYTNCYGPPESATGWDQSVCSTTGDARDCSINCAVDGIDYQNAVGVTVDGGGSVTLDYVTKYVNNGQTSTNIGARLFLMDENDANYKGFNLLNQEFSFTVNASTIPCGVNGALYFVQMPIDGGLADSPTYNSKKLNTAGPQFGTGYCDSQCAQSLKFIDGLANSPGWNDTTATGQTGTCCAEMDIWEASQLSSAFTPHPCSVNQSTSCTGSQCGSDYSGSTYEGLCDKAGCDFNTFRMGDQTFYGPTNGTQSFDLDTTQLITVVTQFLTHDNTDTGDLVEIKRFYYQGGKLIDNASSSIPNIPPQNYIDDKLCSAQKKEFNDDDTYSKLGGLSTMSDSMKAGHVLVLSIWDDNTADMNWLDSITPSMATPPYAPGVQRGTCSPSVGIPGMVEGSDPGASVTFSDIKFGPINSTLPTS